MAARSSRFTHVSLGSLEDKILLSDRQLKLLEERRRRLDSGKDDTSKNLLPTKPIKPPLAVHTTKPDPVKQRDGSSWSLEQTNTAPTTSWESSAAASDASSSSSASGTSVANLQKSFYGQGLPGKERKKMYDDTGASYYESTSEASASAVSTSSHKKLESASTALTEALTKTSSHDSSNVSEVHQSPSVAPSIKSETMTARESQYGSHVSSTVLDKKAHLKKRFMASMAEKRKEQGKPVVPLVTEVPKERRQSFGLNRPKSKAAPDDQQRAFLRNLIQSAYKPKDQPNEESQPTNQPTTSSGISSANSAVSVARSGSSCSASSEDKATMRRFVERSRKKRLSNGNRQNFVKASSTKMKKLLAPHLSPRSHTSDESANDERSFNDQAPRSATPKRNRKTPTNGRRTPRREKTNRSPRFLSAVSRWSGGSQADDEAETHEQERTHELTESSTDSEMNTTDNRAPNTVTKATDVCESTPGHGSIKEKLEFDEGSPMDSRPSEFHAPSIKEVESYRHARAVTESLMEPIDLDSPKVQTTCAPSNTATSFTDSEKLHSSFPELDTLDEEEVESEGYEDFLATLKAEAAGSHSLLWKRFHGLFNKNRSAPSLSDRAANHFSDTTKEMVTEMSTYLKKNPHVLCTSGTQLANDKAVRQNPNPKAIIHQSFYASTEASFDELDSDKENDRDLKLVPSTDSINEAVGSNEIEVTLRQYVRESVEGIAEKKTVPPPLKPTMAAIQPSTVKPTGEIRPKKLNVVPPPPSSADNSVPWSDVKLRSVADANKSEATVSSIPASWTKVKLRPVSAKNDKGKDQPPGGFGSEANTNIGDDSSDFRRILVSKKKPSEHSQEKKEPAKKSNEPEVIEIIDLADIPSTESNPIDLTSKSNEDKPIDLTDSDLTGAETPRTDGGFSHADTKANASFVTSDGTVLVSLAPEPDSDPVKVLVGRKGLVKIRTQLGETKAQVIWRVDLDDVQSALLDLASFKVKLLLNSKDENKDLAFATSDQCMRFANALHEMSNASAGDHVESVSVEESVFVEQLNEEEQRVLEEFRQSKKQLDGPSLYSINTDHDKPMSVINANGNAPYSPLSEISGPGSALSSADLRVAQKYQTMLKLQVPKEAVRHKMEQDCVNPKVIDFVLGAEVDEASQNDQQPKDPNMLSDDEEKIASGYKKMLKMGIPVEAVQHKMEKEGVDRKIMIAVLGSQQVIDQKAAEPAVSGQLTSQEEVIATQYRKMLKMMIPHEAVEHKMRKDQIDEKIIASVLGINPKPSSAAVDNSIPKLTDEEESVASSYRKMLGLRIPKEAVRQKMESEGISQKIIASVLGLKLSSQEDKKNPIKRGKQGFHWNPLNSSENLKNSVWSKSSFDSGFLDDDDDISTQVEQFAKKPDSDEASRITVKSSSDSKEKAKLIDLSRANNIAITLKAFNDFPHAELAKIIEFVDPFEKVKGDRALFMKDLLPNAAEIKVIKTYQGDEERLVPAEKWFRQIVHIKRIDEKIHVLRTMESFRNEAIALGETFEQLTNVCHQVMTSDKLPDLLEMVRQIGNRMNDGRGQEAAGFKLDFLPRLAQTKGSDKKTTALDLVVMIFNTRGRREALQLADDFPDCQEASRIQIGELIADVKMLSGAMRKCQQELDALKKEIGQPPRSRPALSLDIRSDSGIKNTKDSIGDNEVRTQVSNMHEELFARRSQLINSVLNKGQGEQETTKREEKPVAINPHEKSYSQQGAINRIKKFIDEAKIIYPELETKRDRALSACRELAEFFCESGGERTATTLLGILAEFASNLDKALSKYDQQQKADAKKKTNKDNAPQSTKSAHDGETRKKKTKTSANAEKKSLVLMVNEMLKIAGDKEKADFIKGVTYENPDSRLRQIYEAEQTLLKTTVGSPSTTKKNILHTIEERRQLDGSHDSQLALSELARAMQSRSASTDSMSPTAQSLYSQSNDSQGSSSSMDQKLNQPSRRKPNKMTIAERWTRKAHNEDESVDENAVETEKTNSQILASESQDSEDRRFEEKKRQEYMSRWASKKNLLPEKTENNDLENESDVGALLDYNSKTRQRYINRWASKPDAVREDESIPSS